MTARLVLALLTAVVLSGKMIRRLVPLEDGRHDLPPELLSAFAVLLWCACTTAAVLMVGAWSRRRALGAPRAAVGLGWAVLAFAGSGLLADLATARALPGLPPGPGGTVEPALRWLLTAMSLLLPYSLVYGWVLGRGSDPGTRGVDHVLAFAGSAVGYLALVTLRHAMPGGLVIPFLLLGATLLGASRSSPWNAPRLYLP